MNMQSSMKCERVKELLPEFVVSNGKMRIAPDISAHLESCEECTKEYRALMRTGELLDSSLIDPVPDQWSAVSARLRPRSVVGRAGLRGWIVGHRLQSAFAFSVTAALVIGVFTAKPPVKPSSNMQPMYMNHVSMIWREPFADHAGLGLASAPQVELQVEYPN